MKRLWGDNFYSAKEKKWSKEMGPGYERGFCKLVLDPIYKVRHIITTNNYNNVIITDRFLMQ